MHKKRQQNKWICVFCLQPLVTTVINPRLERLVFFENEPYPSPLTGEGELSSDEGDIKYIQTTAPDTVLQGHAILPLSKGEDRMLNERKRINSILGGGSSCRVASAMLNLFQYLTNKKKELLAKKIFTPQHLASLACNLFTNKILNQVQDDITKNSHENFPFTPSEKERCKSLCFQTWRLNKSEKGRYKSQQFQTWHLNISEKGRYKSQQFQTWHLNISEKGGYKSQQFQAWHLYSNVKGGCKTC